MHDGSSPQRPLTSTSVLLDRAGSGDESATEALIQRYLPALQRWAHGRLSPENRGLVDTVDLVQMTLVKAVRNLEGFESRKKGAFFAYLRRILLNTLRDEVRKAVRRPRGPEIEDQLPDDTPSPLENVLGREKLRIYEEALSRLPEPQQELLILRLELGQSHGEIADALGLATPNAARMKIARAIVKLEANIHELW
jgi:RNA polymerase sigma factor (sigma-70 family)